MPINERRHAFLEATRGLLEAIIVIYAAVFHKSTTFKSVRDAGPQVFADDHDLHMRYQGVWKALPSFCKFAVTGHGMGTGCTDRCPPDQQVLAQVSPTDELFKEYIVRKEMGIMAKGRPSRKCT
jgi:hypothetical protein